MRGLNPLHLLESLAVTPSTSHCESADTIVSYWGDWIPGSVTGVRCHTLMDHLQGIWSILASNCWQEEVGWLHPTHVHCSKAVPPFIEYANCSVGLNATMCMVLDRPRTEMCGWTCYSKDVGRTAGLLSVVFMGWSCVLCGHMCVGHIQRRNAEIVVWRAPL